MDNQQQTVKTIRKDWPKVRHYVKKGNPNYQIDLPENNYDGPKWKELRPMLVQEKIRIREPFAGRRMACLLFATM